MKSIRLQGRARTAAALLASLLAASVAAAQAPTVPRTTETTMDSRTLIRQSFDAWSAGTGSPFDLLADDATWTIAGNSLASGTYTSREQFLERVIRPFNARLSDRLKPTVHRILVDGSTVIVYFDAEATARDGKPYRNTYVWILDLEGDRITGVVAFFDALAFDDLWKRVPPAVS